MVALYLVQNSAFIHVAFSLSRSFIIKQSMMGEFYLWFVCLFNAAFDFVLLKYLFMRAYGFQSAFLSISFLIMISHFSLSSPISVTNYIVDKNSSSGPFLRRLSVFLLKPFDELNSSNWSFLLILDLIENFSIFENISIRFDMLQSTMLPSRLIQE